MARDKKLLPARFDLAYLISFGFLSQICPKTLVDDVLNKLGKSSKRIRLFPASLVVYFILAMSLWREVPIEEVIRILVENINFINKDSHIYNCPNKSAISQARTQLGSQVMKEIAKKVLVPIALPDCKEAWFKGMRLMALDGTTFDLPDEKDNADHYGYPSSSRGDAAFPQARVLSLIETGTHVVTAAEIGSYKRSEIEMAKSIIGDGKFKADMLILADRNFYGYELWTKAIATGAKLLWRAKTNLRLRVDDRLDDGSYLSKVYDSRDRKSCEPKIVRVIEYTLKDRSINYSENSVGEDFYRLLTNITDPALGSAVELAELYHERWEIETLFGEIKKSLLFNSTVIRSKKHLLVEQELWGLIIIHYAIRKSIAQAAWKHNTDPDKLSFKNVVQVIKRKMPRFAASPPRRDGQENGEESNE
jgi:hypothetical protein